MFGQIDTSFNNIVITLAKMNEQEIKESIKKMAQNNITDQYTSMELSGEVDSIPDFICEFPNIKDLFINPFRGLKLSNNLNCLKKLTTLRVWTEIKMIPDSLKLTNLTIFEVNLYSAKEFPIALTNWENLEQVKFEYSNFTAVPKQISKLRNLEVLSIGNDKIKILPKEIGYLSALRVLSLGTKGLETLPVTVCNLKKLRELYIVGCTKLKLTKSQLNCIKGLPEFETLYK
jgi:Leucine-rich repeat (LRR) protein